MEICAPRSSDDTSPWQSINLSGPVDLPGTATLADPTNHPSEQFNFTEDVSLENALDNVSEACSYKRTKVEYKPKAAESLLTVL
jgi:hypothetical protein